MNFRTTLFLLVVVIAVGVTLFFKTRHTDDTDKPAKVDEHKLVDLNSADVSRLSVTASDGTRTVLERKDGKWNLTEPVSASAKTFEVDDLVRALTDLKSREKVEASKKVSGGLDHPSFVVELTGKDGKKTKFSFGDKSAVGDSLYVQVNDSIDADVVGNGIYATLEKPASTYRDLRLVSTPSAEIRQLSITSKTGTIRLAKPGQDWTIVAPAGIPADQSAITELLSSLTTLEASEFVDSPNARVKNSLNRPKLTVSLSTKTPTTQPAATQPAEAEIPGGQTIRFGGFKDVLNKDVYVSLNNKEVALVAASSETGFEKTPLDLRDRNLLDLKPDRVSTIMLSMNRPATTQPTTRPAESHEFTIERQKIAPPTLGPALPANLPAPTTQPSNVPATQSAATQPATTQPTEVAATQPTTQPALPKWLFTSGDHGPADEGQINDLLEKLHPLHVEKYHEPKAVTGTTYTLRLHLIPASAADNAEDVLLTIIDTGTQVEGTYKDLHFDVDRILLDALTGDFKTKKPPSTPQQFNGGGGAEGLPFGHP